MDGTLLNGLHFYAPRGLSQDSCAPNVVFIHGVGGSQRQWRDLIPLLDSDIHPLFIDLPGHGNSLDVVPVCMEEILLKLENFFKEIQIDSQLNIVGHSLGGLITQAYYFRNPSKVKKLVLISTAPKIILHPYLREQMCSGKWDLEFLKAGFALNLSEEAKQMVVEDMISIRLSPNGDFMGIEDIDFSNIFSNIQVESLLIFGDSDKIISPRRTRNMAGKIPKVKVVELPNIGHYPHLEEAFEVAKQLNSFLI